MQEIKSINRIGSGIVIFGLLNTYGTLFTHLTISNPQESKEERGGASSAIAPYKPARAAAVAFAHPTRRNVRHKGQL